jgi:hypothetical protein
MMAKMILMDELHLAIKVPRGLDEAACKVIGRTLNDKRFQANLRRVVRDLFSQYSSLREVRLTIAR